MVAWTFRFSGGLSYHWFALGLVLGVMFGGGFVLSIRSSAPSVAFGRSFWRWFRLIGRGLGWQRSGSMKPLELARARLAVRFLR